MYSKIINPITNRKVNINNKKGKTILLNYINLLKGSGKKIFLPDIGWTEISTEEEKDNQHQEFEDTEEYHNMINEAINDNIMNDPDITPYVDDYMYTMEVNHERALNQILYSVFDNYSFDNDGILLESYGHNIESIRRLLRMNQWNGRRVLSILQENPYYGTSF